MPPPKARGFITIHHRFDASSFFFRPKGFAPFLGDSFLSCVSDIFLIPLSRVLPNEDPTLNKPRGQRFLSVFPAVPWDYDPYPKARLPPASHPSAGCSRSRKTFPCRAGTFSSHHPAASGIPPGCPSSHNTPRLPARHRKKPRRHSGNRQKNISLKAAMERGSLSHSYHGTSCLKLCTNPCFSKFSVC